MPQLLEFWKEPLSEKTLCANSILPSGGSRREKLETKMANILKPKLRMHREKSQWPRSPQIDDQDQEISENLLKTYPRQLLYRTNLGHSPRELSHRSTALPDSNPVLLSFCSSVSSTLDKLFSLPFPNRQHQICYQIFALPASTGILYFQHRWTLWATVCTQPWVPQFPV